MTIGTKHLSSCMIGSYILIKSYDTTSTIASTNALHYHYSLQLFKVQKLAEWIFTNLKAFKSVFVQTHKRFRPKEVLRRIDLSTLLSCRWRAREKKTWAAAEWDNLELKTCPQTGLNRFNLNSTSQTASTVSGPKIRIKAGTANICSVLTCPEWRQQIEDHHPLAFRSQK